MSRRRGPFTAFLEKQYAPASWTACSVCERRRGEGFLCESCSAPSVLVKHETRPHPPQFSLEWWRERIADEKANPPGVLCEYEAWLPVPASCFLGE